LTNDNKITNIFKIRKHIFLSKNNKQNNKNKQTKQQKQTNNRT